MNSNELDKASPPRSGRGVLCVACEHLNPLELAQCERCRAQLHVSCHHCGKSNERVRTRCTSCGRRLHRGVVHRCRRTLSENSRRLNVLMVLLFVGAMVFAYFMIQLVSGVRLPRF